MEMNKLPETLTTFFRKYRYVIIVLLIGLILMLLPVNSKDKTQTITDNDVSRKEQSTAMEVLADLLSSVQGAGDVQVFLSVSEGEETIYQTDSNVSGMGENGSTQIKTVIVTDSQHNQTGLVRQINPPAYLGAVVVCQGADSPAVRLAITTAVSKITGLGADDICVLKMK